MNDLNVQLFIKHVLKGDQIKGCETNQLVSKPGNVPIQYTMTRTVAAVMKKKAGKISL